MIEGEKIQLRAIEKTDLKQLMEWRNQPDYRQFFREYRELNFDNQENWFQKVVMQDKNTIMFAILDRTNNELIGACGLCYIDWINQNAEFSIYIGKNRLYIDDIYANEATYMVMKYCFDELNMHRLWAEIYEFDEKKKKLFKTMNFEQEGRHKETHWTNGAWCDSLYYSILREKYSNELKNIVF